MASICNNNDDYQPYFIIDANLYRLLVTMKDVDCLIKSTAKKQIEVLKLRCSADKNNILHIAACFGQVPLVEKILEKWSQLMIEANSQGDLAIHSCLRSGRFCAIGLMIDWLNKNNSKAKQVLEWNSNHRGDTLLHIALELCDSNNYEIVKKMVDLFPAASYATNKEGICPLYIAIKRQHPCLVRHILLKLQPMKAEALACLMNGLSVIHVALSAAGTDMLEHLLSFGGEELIKLKDKNGWTALSCAASMGNFEKVEIFESKVPESAFICNKDRSFPIHLAVLGGHPPRITFISIIALSQVERLFDRRLLYDILKSIIEIAPDLVDSVDIRGRSPLSYAAHIGHVKGVQLLIERFPHLEFKRDEDIDGSFPIHQAAKGGHIEVIKLLHPTLCLVNNKHQNILHVAAATGRNTTVKYLLMLQEFKELINTRDDNGNTPLHLAVKGYRETVAHYLAMENNIDGNSLNNDLLTARDLFEVQLQYADQRVTNNPTSLQIHLIDLTLKQVGAVKSSLRETYDAQVNDETKYESNQTKRSIGISSREREIRQRLTNRERAGNLLVVAALIVTVTFAAAFTPPGGFNEKTGMPTLHNNSTFKVLIYFNAFAFIFALGSAITLILGMTLHKFAEITLYWGWCFIILGLISMSIAFMTASSFASQQALNSKASLASLTISMTIMISLLIAIPFLMLASTKFVQVSKLYVKLLLSYCAVDSVGIDLAI